MKAGRVLEEVHDRLTEEHHSTSTVTPKQLLSPLVEPSSISENSTIQPDDNSEERLLRLKIDPKLEIIGSILIIMFQSHFVSIVLPQEPHICWGLRIYLFTFEYIGVRKSHGIMILGIGEICRIRCFSSYYSAMSCGFYLIYIYFFFR